VDQDPRSGSSAEPGSTVVPTVSTQHDLVTVPDLVGMSEADALVALTAVGLRLTGVSEVASAAPSGQVLASDPASGSIVAEGSGVDITVAAEPAASSPQPAPSP
jgi:serine/threonine-protein kinase